MTKQKEKSAFGYLGGIPPPFLISNSSSRPSTCQGGVPRTPDFPPATPRGLQQKRGASAGRGRTAAVDLAGYSRSSVASDWPRRGRGSSAEEGGGGEGGGGGGGGSGRGGEEKREGRAAWQRVRRARGERRWRLRLASKSFSSLQSKTPYP
ncbi:zinc finger protein 746-like [Lynx pardinus]|uniref:Zinc finger protein 746-like n=1 Tax=Lynx pardinus TaxID=191816 RepID=A0A485MSX5_LYNPA|nr:zinc finger protein 746-like [Lynx pardinus]